MRQASASLVASSWATTASAEIRKLRDQAKGQEQGQLAYLLEGAAREADAVAANAGGTATKKTHRIYTAETLADRWVCSSALVRSLCTSGELECMRLGKLIRISAEAVERYEARGV